MPSFTSIFLAALILTTGLRLWLALRQMRHVWRYRDQPPAELASALPPDLAADYPVETHRKAADYTLAKSRLGLAHLGLDVALLLTFTLGGGLQWLHEALGAWFAAPLLQGAALLLALFGLLALAELPLAFHGQFVTEARFGFNRQTVAGFVADHLKQAVLGLVILGPLAVLVLWLMGTLGELWWLGVWLAWSGFNLLILAVYPTFIAPLFNKFTPLDDPGLLERIRSLLARAGFTARGVFVMDGSRRTSHGNAYFTGLGQSKRIVFFDNLLAQLSPEQVEAVLAHELGHYKRHHIAKRIALMFGLSLALLLVLAWLKEADWFYAGLGLAARTDALALALFFLALPVFLFPLTPLMSLYSRRHEFEADEFAARHSQPGQLIAALVRLYKDNAATLTPDPLHSLFYDSHPKAVERIARLRALSAYNHTPAQIQRA